MRSARPNTGAIPIMRSCGRTALHNAASKVDVSRARLICGRYDELPAALATRFGDIADGVVLPPLADRNDDDPMRACITELQRR